MEELRRIRKEKGLSQAKLAVLADLDPSTVNQIEVGARWPNTKTLEKIAAVLGVGVADLYPKAEVPLPFEDPPSLEDMPSLEELHAAAECATDWLVKPALEWQAAWGLDPLDLTPREAMRILHEVAAEIVALRPAMAEQERGLPWPERMFSGRYMQAWRRYLNAAEAAKICGEAHGLIGPEGTPNDLAEKLGENPTKPLEELLLAAG